MLIQAILYFFCRINARERGWLSATSCSRRRMYSILLLICQPTYTDETYATVYLYAINGIISNERMAMSR